MQKQKRKALPTPRQSVYSTDILRKHPNTNFALADVVNLNRAAARSITVQVFDWSNGSPVPLVVTPCNRKKCTLVIPANKSKFLFADIWVEQVPQVGGTVLHLIKLIQKIAGKYIAKNNNIAWVRSYSLSRSTYASSE